MLHMLTRSRRFSPHLVLAGFMALTLLSGCAEEEDKSLAFAPACPVTQIPPEAADYYLYDGKTPSFTNLVTRASILTLRGDCIAAGPKELTTRIALRFGITKGAALRDSTITLPWFIVVLHGDKIVNKHIFKHTFTVPANLANFTTDTKVVTVSLPIAPKNIASDYQFQVGFQLNKQQLEYNKNHKTGSDFRSY
ncbi:MULTISPECIES: hypothetical protein [Acetobacter]|uniref:Lipoprotein n=1 Tax=Acetobacter thailandicus TaxID=1502842 RepID=A0ABT3QC10_9PROT|nr:MULTISPECIES: hypothetical protein [Acetobacter]MBS0959049.1 hypothetical protein [Acetobacter thailandicus]MBS0980403.1 hypothetical protein [Acetobacter thailandicus]MBS0985064.1 hypothetical protein [Acetobacter thailandicus]MBS1003397.1 hypothetical protein [Acetobacter thailandicus]MCX2562769.1 hypothetical protein [Acetobacter thailandicus]